MNKRVKPLLQAIEPATAVMPWGVSPIYSWDQILIWDIRDDASFAIMEAIAASVGHVDEVDKIQVYEDDTIGVTLIGILISKADGDDRHLSEVAGDLCGRYVMATGDRFKDYPPPF